MLTVVSRAFPPEVSASALVLTNLISSYTGKVTAIAGHDQNANPDPAFHPPCSTEYLTLPSFLSRAYNPLRRNFPEIIYRPIQASIKKILKAVGSKAVLGLYPYEDYFVAAFLATRELGLPFYAHMHDLWMENTSGRLRHFAEKWEPVILKESTRVLCMTEAMQRHYERRYQIRSELLPHCLPDSAFLKAPEKIVPPQMPKPTALFLGTISPEMNLDALKVLASASEILPQDYELLFCTSPDLSSLNQLGIKSSRLKVIKFGSREQARALPSKAHVLIAPLSHKNCSALEVQTVFSGKLLDYFISGRPIIVFAPEDSYHVQSARKTGWGYTVTENSPLALAAAIIKIITDEALSAKLVEAALKEAQSRSAKFYARRLQEWVTQDSKESAYIGDPAEQLIAP